MTPTSVSLLDRLKAAGPDASDWNRLHAVYLPLIERWLGRVPGLGDRVGRPGSGSSGGRVSRAAAV